MVIAGVANLFEDAFGMSALGYARPQNVLAHQDSNLD